MRNYSRPNDASDELVAAVGKLSEAFETLERARGHLYELHQLMGHTDLLFGDAVDKLKQAGAHPQAKAVEQQVIGRNILQDRWTFQIVDEFNQLYYEPVKQVIKAAEAQLMSGTPHVFEAEMKQRERQGKTYDQPGA